MKKKKTAAMVGAGILGTVLVVGSTVAYLTDKDEVSNQFTVGRVEIEGKEPNYTPDPDGKTEDIVPTEVIPKDPQITNTGKNDAYVYMDVSIPIAKVITVDEQGKRQNGGAAQDTELFTMNERSDQWTLMYQRQVGESMVYTYSYNEILAPQETTVPLFQSVTFANVVEGQLEEKQLDIPVNFYAIQSLNTGTGSNVVEQAADAWQKYVNQNDGQPGEAVAPLAEVQNEANTTPAEDQTEDPAEDPDEQGQADPGNQSASQNGADGEDEPENQDGAETEEQPGNQNGTENQPGGQGETDVQDQPDNQDGTDTAE